MKRRKGEREKEGGSSRLAAVVVATGLDLGGGRGGGEADGGGDESEG